MPNIKDITGLKYGRLTVIEKSGKLSGEIAWKCKCDCGTIVIASGHQMKRGKKKSCGCQYDISNKARLTTHGKTKTRLYKIWENMKSRCYNPKNTNFKYYGFRGINICHEWLTSFQLFYDWSISNGYSDKLTIDRINNDGNYTPDNCRWVTMLEQSRNKRRCAI